MTAVLDRTPGRTAGRRSRTGPVAGAPFVVPALSLVTAWVYLPLAATVMLSLTSWNLTSGPPVLVGLANYADLLTRPDFRSALGHTLLLVVLLLPFATVVPMGLAVLLWRGPVHPAGVYRALLFLPMVLAPVATAVSWQFVLNPLQGVANAALGLLGIPGPNWLGDPRTALPTIALITAGKLVALNVLLYGAALDRIEPRVVDAARLDGATRWEQTRYLVLPHLWRTTSLLAGVCAVLAGQWAFTNVAVLTQGGPAGATDNAYFWIYTTGFTFFDIGTASAGAVVLIVLLGAPLVLRAAVLRRRDRRAAP